MSEMNMYMGEVFGTAMLLLMGLSTVANISLKHSGMGGSGGLMAAFGWGAAMCSAAVIVGPISGAHCNPAFTLGFALAGRLPWALVPGYMLAQVVGAVIGTLIVWFIYKDHLDREDNPEAKLGVFVTGASILNPVRNVAAEATATFCVMIIVLSLGHISPAGGVPLLYVYIGLSGGVMAFGGLTGYAINPTRDLIPRILHTLLPIKGKRDSNWSYSWIPVLGPSIGAILAGLIYNLLFSPIFSG